MPTPKTNNPRHLPWAWIVIGITIAAIVVSAVYLVYSRRAAAPSEMSPSPSTAPTTTESPASEAPKAAGNYVIYSALAFEQAGSSSRKVLFFHAGWCPQCRAIEKDINEQGVPSGMTIFKVDYDTADDLKMKYGVTLQTTIIEVDSSGNLIKKHVAYNKPTLPAVLDALGR